MLKTKHWIVMSVAVALSSCGGAPSCDNSTALKILSRKGYSDLENVITLAVNEKAKHVTCQGHPQGWFTDIQYRVFRTAEGDVVVTIN